MWRNWQRRYSGPNPPFSEGIPISRLPRQKIRAGASRKFRSPRWLILITVYLLCERFVITDQFKGFIRCVKTIREVNAFFSQFLHKYLMLPRLDSNQRPGDYRAPSIFIEAWTISSPLIHGCRALVGLIGSLLIP